MDTKGIGDRLQGVIPSRIRGHHAWATKWTLPFIPQMKKRVTSPLFPRKLQIPSSHERAHYVKTCVRVHRYVDATMALFHGPRRLAVYDTQGKLIEQEFKQAA